MKKVSGPQVVSSVEAAELPLPAEIQAALGKLVGAAREGLLALSVGVGLRVVHELMEAEIDEVAELAVFLAGECGLAPRTVDKYTEVARRFLVFRAAGLHGDGLALARAIGR